MFKTLKNAWGIPELRKKMLFTLFIIILYRIGAAIPVPYIDYDGMKVAMTETFGDTLFGFFNMLSGSAFSRATLFALSVSPYITSSIVMQLLTIAIPALERLSKNGEEGKKKITQITRYVTVILAVITAYGYYAFMKAYDCIEAEYTGFFYGVVIVACYTAGSALIMWLAEKIEEQGIGNGISIILFANIVAGLPSFISSAYETINANFPVYGTVVIAIAAVIFMLATVTFAVFITNSERRLPVQYAKRVVGRKMYGGQSTTLPLKLNMSGVMPIIFANTIVSLPATIIAFVNPKQGTFWYKLANDWLSYSSPIYALILFVLIIAFAYFYIAISFNPVEVSNNLMQNGGFIPGIRPGKPTAAYITKSLNKITLIGALFLSVIAVLPIIIYMASMETINLIMFTGSSLLIVVGVALETFRELEGQITMRHYKGFLG